MDDTDLPGILSEKVIKIAVGVLVATVTGVVWYLGLNEVVKESVLCVLYYAARILGQ